MIESKTFMPALKALPLILMGLGIVLSAAVGFFILQDVSPPRNDFSTVPVKVEYPAPDLTLTDMQGTSRSLKEYRGQVILINLWATWCIPCTKEMPTLQTFYDQYKENAFVVIAINDGEPTINVLQFVKDYELAFSIWLDPNYQATEQAFKTMNLPSSFVIDREGIVRWMWVGGISGEMLEKHIAPLIKNQ
jgi:peroxiredoxin